MYSWVRSNCETELEYLVSKSILLKYLRSDDFLSVFGSQNVDRIFKFIRGCIETVESSCCFFRRKNCRHFDVCMNTAHEGTNNGIKYCAAPVLPTYSLNKTAQVLSKNSSITARQRSIVVAQDLVSSKLWSDLPTSNHLTTLGEGLVVEQWKQRNEYESIRIGLHQFQVRRRTQDISKSVIPVFRRIRLVSIQSDCLYCNCCYFERIGIGCRHILHVLGILSAGEYPGFSHKDISVYWWSMYAHYG
jgi:hypothetical protein